MLLLAKGLELHAPLGASLPRQPCKGSPPTTRPGTLVRESMIIASGGGPPPPWQLPPLGWVAGRTDAEDGIDPALCPVDDADADLACAVDTHLQATRPQMISIHPNVLNHVSGRKPKVSRVPEGHGAPTKIWNQVPRRVLASWCRLLGRRKPRQRQSANGLPQPARMLPHRWNGIRGRLVATAGASTLPNRRSLMRGLAAGRANRDGVDAAFAGRGREWS